MSPERAQRGWSGWAYLAGSAGFSPVPAAVCATVSREGGTAAQQDVEDDPQTPKVATLVVEGSLISEHLHYFRSHVLCWSTLRETHSKDSGNCHPLVWFERLCACAMNSKQDFYRCGELWRRYRCTGAAELHSTSQVEITDFNWGHLGRNIEENHYYALCLQGQLMSFWKLPVL